MKGSDSLRAKWGIRGMKRYGITKRDSGLSALLTGSALQAFALLLYLGFYGLTSLYGISGLFQGGVVPICGDRTRVFFLEGCFASASASR